MDEVCVGLLCTNKLSSDAIAHLQPNPALIELFTFLL